MSLLSLTRRAGAFTLLVHAVRCTAALLIATPLLTAWQPLLELNLYRADPSAADAALLLEAAAVLGPEALRWSGIAGAIYLLLAPLFTLGWLNAMADVRGLRAQLSRAGRRYPAGLLLLLLTWLAYAIIAGLLWLALQPERFAWLPADERVEQLGLAGAILTGALIVLVVSTISDLAFAALAVPAKGSGWPSLSALPLALRTLSPALVAQHALLAALAGAVAPLADAFVRAVPWLVPDAALLFTQALMLVATALRGLWLAIALHGVQRARELRARRAVAPAS